MPGAIIVQSQGRIAAIIFEAALFAIYTEPEEMWDRRERPARNEARCPAASIV